MKFEWEIVRCRDCEWWSVSPSDHETYCELAGVRCDELHFCSWGEKKDALMKGEKNDN